MKISFLLSTKGGSPLQVGLERGLKQLGHEVEYFGQSHADLYFIFNQVAHTTDYVYPPFPASHKRIVFIDAGEYGYFRRLPSVIKSYATTFCEGAMNHDTKNKEQQLRLVDLLQGLSFPYFLREFSKHLTFPENYHPIDYPLYAYSVEPRPPNREEYLRRHLDLFVSWGASHPWRLEITKALRACHVKADIRVIEENGTPRMPQAEYFRSTRSAKCSVSFDGYGSGSFRMTEVLVRTLLLQGPLSIHRYQPLIDGVHCIEYAVNNDGETFLDTDVCAKLSEALKDPERSYRIYEQGYHHCMAHYTERATAEYVLRTVEKHDWSKATALTI
jgi:hypothetical protein